MRHRLIALAVLCSVAGSLQAFVTHTVSRWPDGNIVMHLQLGNSGTLIDGSTSWGEAVEPSLASWNAQVSRVQFRVVRDSTAPRLEGNDVNNVFFQFERIWRTVR